MKRRNITKKRAEEIEKMIQGRESAYSEIVKTIEGKVINTIEENGSLIIHLGSLNKKSPIKEIYFDPIPVRYGDLIRAHYIQADCIDNGKHVSGFGFSEAVDSPAKYSLRKAKKTEIAELIEILDKKRKAVGRYGKLPDLNEKIRVREF